MNASKKNEKLIILDRDGVINLDSDDFIKTPDEWLPIPGSIEAISSLYKAGYSIYVLSNQSGIARQLFSLNTLEEIHDKMRNAVRQAGGEIAGIYFCPHGPNDNCLCRKPLSGLYEQLAADLSTTPDVLFNGVDSIGDSVRDLQAAKTAGAKPVLVTTGKGMTSKQALLNNKEPSLQNIEIYSSLSDYTEQLLNYA